MKSIFLLAATLFFFTAFPQSEGLKFESKQHDFGNIKEVDGSATHEFAFTNELELPVRITGVKASCGCTTPGWTKEEIAPGESGFVKASYNPRNRPGPFRKSLTVSVAGLAQPVRLYISGVVEGRPKTIEEEYPHLSGNLRMKRNVVNFGKIKTSGKLTYRYLEVYNYGGNPIMFKEEVESPSYIDVSFEPRVLQPQQKGRIKFSYDASSRGDLGYFNDEVILLTDDNDLESKKITIMATVEEYFAPMTPEEAALAPKLEIEKQVRDLGAIEQGTKKEINVLLKNVGKNDLMIRKIDSSCDCISLDYTPSIAAGSEQTLKISLDTDKLKGRMYNALYVYSNDPRRPTQMIRITGTVRASN